MAYRIELEDPSGDQTSIAANDVLDVDIQRPHTALSDWKATIPYDPLGARDWTTSVVETRIYYVRADGSEALLFRGYLERAKSNERDGTTVLEGRGIGRDLLDAEADIRFTDTETHVAIQQIWDMTGFDATVYNPSAVGTSSEVGQDASTTSGFQDILSSLSSTDPVVIQNDTVTLTRTGWTTEAENAASITGATTVSDAEFSGGSGLRFDADGEAAYWDFTPDHDIPADDVQVWVREYAGISTGQVRILFGPVGNLERLDTIPDDQGTINLGWRDYANDPRTGNGYTNGDLSAGTTYRVRIEHGTTSETDDAYDVDLVAPLDGLTRYDPTPTYTFDNDNGGASGYLDGPEHFPTDGIPVDFDTVDDEDNVDAVDLTTSWDNLSNGQELKASNDGGQSFPLSAANSDALTGDFTTTYGSRLVGRATIAGYGTRTTATPQQGFQAQALQSWTLSYDASAVSVVEDKRYSGDLLSILQKLHKKAGYRFSIDQTTTPPTVESFETGTQSKAATYTVNNRNPARDLFDYANRVTVFGALQDDGTRPSATAEDSDEIQALGGDPDGVRHVTLVRSDLQNLDDVRSAARSEVGSRVAERSDTGELEIQPKNVLPGYNYDVDWYSDGNPTSTPSEKVSISEQHEGADGRIQFDRPRGTAIRIVQARYAQSITDDAI